MYIAAQSLDDLLKRVLEKLLQKRNSINPTRGKMVEITGVLLKLGNPRARLSRTETKGKIYSCLGELFWYLSKDNQSSPIIYYIAKYEKEVEGDRIWGGYGPRLFGMRNVNQIDNIIKLLSYKPASKRAVIQLFNAEDIETETDEAKRHKDIPCTCTLQFMVRNGRLDLLVNMRSNDAFFGLPHDVFAFTMLQEMIARSLGIELGNYKHCVGSLHLYTDYINGAKKYVAEGYQSTKLQMPPMPLGEPWPVIETIVKMAADIRTGVHVDEMQISLLEPYWADLIRLLQIFHIRNGGNKNIGIIQKKMFSRVYDVYISGKQKHAHQT